MPPRRRLRGRKGRRLTGPTVACLSVAPPAAAEQTASGASSSGATSEEAAAQVESGSLSAPVTEGSGGYTAEALTGRVAAVVSRGRREAETGSCRPCADAERTTRWVVRVSTEVVSEEEVSSLHTNGDTVLEAGRTDVEVEDRPQRKPVLCADPSVGGGTPVENGVGREKGGAAVDHDSDRTGPRGCCVAADGNTAPRTQRRRGHLGHSGSGGEGKRLAADFAADLKDVGELTSPPSSVKSSSSGNPFFDPVEPEPPTNGLGEGSPRRETRLQSAPICPAQSAAPATSKAASGPCTDGVWAGRVGRPSAQLGDRSWYSPWPGVRSAGPLPSGDAPPAWHTGWAGRVTGPGQAAADASAPSRPVAEVDAVSNARPQPAQVSLVVETGAAGQVTATADATTGSVCTAPGTRQSPVLSVSQAGQSSPAAPSPAWSGPAAAGGDSGELVTAGCAVCPTCQRPAPPADTAAREAGAASSEHHTALRGAQTMSGTVSCNAGLGRHR